MHPIVALVSLAARCPARTPPTPIAAPAQVVEPRRDAATDRHDTAVVDAGPPAPVAFVPRVHCHTAGNGSVGAFPHVTLYFRGEPPHENHAVRGRLVLHDQRVLLRLEDRDPAHATVVLTNARGAESARRTFALRAGALDLLAEDARGPGLAQWDGTTLTLEYLAPVDASAADPLAGLALSPATPVCTVAHESLVMVAMIPEPVEIPRFTGLPPLTAQAARWMLSRDARGACIAGFEALGPWGVTHLDATERGLTGKLSMGDAVNPVACEPTP